MRLRTILLVLLLLGVGLWFRPRLAAAWRVQGMASPLADYGLCLAGPTGAELVLSDRASLVRVARRRLVSASLGQAPFRACAKLGAELSGDIGLTDRYSLPAEAFEEYGLGARGVRLERLVAQVIDLVALHEQAWPVIRKPLSELVRPSAEAKEAIHPVELERPTPVQGLSLSGARLRAVHDTPKGWFFTSADGDQVKAFRSRDAGRTWSATSPWQSALEGYTERCRSGELDFAFGLGNGPEGSSWMLFTARERRPLLRLSPGVLPVAAACEGDTTTVLLAGGRDGKTRELRTCRADAGCTQTKPPEWPRLAAASQFDLARVGGALVFVVAESGLLRVTTTRDGVTFTPLSLVLDLPALGWSPASLKHVQLLAVGKELRLYVDVQGKVFGLASTDLGAGWHRL